MEVIKMLNIEYVGDLNSELNNIIDVEFNKFAIKNNIACNYMSFKFVAKENEKIIGILSGHSYYNEVHISELIVLEQYRNKHIGTKLLETAESYYKDKGFQHINLSTYAFQAPEFYKKCGFQVEFIRENKENPKLTKYFLVKYF